MKPTEYIQNVLVTESRDMAPLQERFSVVRNIRLLHGVMGLGSELAEIREMADKLSIDQINLKEEMGDLYWYMGIMIDELGLDPVAIFQDARSIDVQLRQLSSRHGRKATHVSINQMTKSIGTITDLVKKNLMYGKELQVTEINAQLTKLGTEISILLQMFDMTSTEAQERNIEKLRARYGQKFTEAAALERDLAKERKILESK